MPEVKGVVIVGATQADLAQARERLGVILPGEMGINLAASAQCQTQEEADALVEMFTAAIVRFAKKTPDEAEALIRRSIGYYAPECEEPDVALRIFRLFRTEHPILGLDVFNLTWQQKLFAGMRFQADVLDPRYEHMEPRMRDLMIQHTKDLSRWRTTQ